MDSCRKLPSHLEGQTPEGVLKMSDWDSAALVLGDIDYDSHLEAFHEIIQMMRNSRLESEGKIAKIEGGLERGDFGAKWELAESDLIHRYHKSVYRDATHSMTLISLVVPTVERIFRTAFENIRERYWPDDAGDVRKMDCGKDPWDMRFYDKGKGGYGRNTCKGIWQLSHGTGLVEYLPEHAFKYLNALYEYRNNMFHNGLEWPEQDARRFCKKLQDVAVCHIDQWGQWPAAWFQVSKQGGAPWTVSVSEEFARECLAMVQGCVEGIGKYCNDRALRPNKPRQ